MLVFETDNKSFFQSESGGHRFQRVPPTEKSCRVHTSTVTVAVLDGQTSTATFDMKKLYVEYYRAGGKGGQHRNKVETACRLRYGSLETTCADQRSKRQNYQRALAELKRRFQSQHQATVKQSENTNRKDQIGTGMRGDKIRTYRYQDNMVVDHRTGKKLSLASVLKGKW